MKNRKRSGRPSIKELINEAFMKAPIPMSITRAKDGTYVEANEVALKYMGLKREEIIGRQSSELGHFPKEKRHLFINEIKEKGFAKNIPLELPIGNMGILKIFFGVYPVKTGDETFYISFAHAISNHQPKMKKFKDDTFHKMTFLDYAYVKSKLEQYILTSRQQEIALLAVMGYSNREIAKKLFISEFTVKDHLKDIFRIIGVRNRNEIFPRLLDLR